MCFLTSFNICPDLFVWALQGLMKALLEQEMEREHDRMKARLLELLESSKTQGTQLQEATQQLEASAVRTRQLCVFSS